MSDGDELVLIGGGEHACVVLEAARSRPETAKVLGYVDPDEGCAVERLGVARLGDDQHALSSDLVRRARFVLVVGAVADSSFRRKVAAKYEAAGARWMTVVHERAIVSGSARLGRGVVVLAGAIVAAGAIVGDHCILNHAAIAEHDVDLGDFVHLGPAAAIGGGTKVGAGVYVGMGAVVRDHISVGAGAVVGMGASVVKDVPSGVTVVGVPARHLVRE